MFRSLVSAFVMLAISPILGGDDMPSGGEPVVEPEAWEDHVESVVSSLSTWPSADQSVIAEVAVAVARHSYAVGIDHRLTVAVMKIENPWLDADTVSHAGAVGLLQVMPKYWAQEFGHCGDDLKDIDVNVCKGTEILRFYIERSSTLKQALLAYNGCSENNPRCQSYPDDVTGQLD